MLHTTLFFIATRTLNLLLLFIGSAHNVHMRLFIYIIFIYKDS